MSGRRAAGATATNTASRGTGPRENQRRTFLTNRWKKSRIVTRSGQDVQEGDERHLVPNGARGEDTELRRFH
jgi:hypothetical protein